MTKKKPTRKQENSTPTESPAFKLFWMLYPFREGAFSKWIAQGNESKHDLIRKPSDAEIEFVESTIGDKLTLGNLRFFLKSKCNVQVVDDLSWRDILTACAKHQNSIKPPVGEIAGLIYEKLKTLPEHKAMIVPEISEWLAREKKIIVDDTTLRTKHLPQLIPYGLYHKKRIGYCLR